MKSLYVDLGMRGQLGKADCGIDVITQELFAEWYFAREKAFQCIAQKPSPKGGITFRIRLNCLSEISRQSHFYSSLERIPALKNSVARSSRYFFSPRFFP
jgi:hypothetical protein